MDITIELRQGYLCATISGPYDYASGVQQFKEVAAAAEKHQCSRVLIDATRITGEIGIMDRHDLGLELVALQKYFTRFAMLARPDQLLPDRFMLNVLRNRGLNGASFINLAEAETWLNQPAE